MVWFCKQKRTYYGFCFFCVTSNGAVAFGDIIIVFTGFILFLLYACIWALFTFAFVRLYLCRQPLKATVGGCHTAIDTILTYILMNMMYVFVYINMLVYLFHIAERLFYVVIVIRE